MKKRICAALLAAVLALTGTSAVWADSSEDTVSKQEDSGLTEVNDGEVTEDANSETDTATDAAGESSDEDSEGESTDASEEIDPETAEEESSENIEVEDAGNQSSDAKISLADDCQGCGTCGADLYWSFYSDGVLQIEGSGDMTDYADASSVPWQAYADIITTVEVDETESGGLLTHLGSHAFDGCVQLKEVSVMSSSGEYLLSVGDHAFDNCLRLSVVPLDHMTEIGAYAFRHCRSLKSFTFIEDLYRIGDYAFSECYNASALNLPDQVTELWIGAGAFEYCISLTEVNFPYGTKEIGAEAFQYCSNLIQMSIPVTVAQTASSVGIGDNAFSGCEELTIHAYKNSFALDYADANGIFTVVQTPLVRYHIYRAINGNDYQILSRNSCRLVAWNNDGKYIKIQDESTFLLTDVQEIEGSDTSTVNDSAISTAEAEEENLIYTVPGDQGVLKIPVTGIAGNAFEGSPDRDTVQTITISQGITEAEAEAFSDLTALTTVKSLGGISYIPERCFSGCVRLQQVTGSELTVLNDIRTEAFLNCSSLTSIELPANTTLEDLLLGDRCFDGCNADLTISDGCGHVLYAMTPGKYKKAATLITLNNLKTAYTGKAISMNPTIQGSGGKVTIHYYLDETLKTKTTASNSGAASKGGAPIQMGVYYVRVHVAEDDYFLSATSRVAKLTIAPAAITSAHAYRSAYHKKNKKIVSMDCQVEWLLGKDTDVTVEFQVCKKKDFSENVYRKLVKNPQKTYYTRNAYGKKIYYSFATVENIPFYKKEFYVRVRVKKKVRGVTLCSDWYTTKCASI